MGEIEEDKAFQYLEGGRDEGRREEGGRKEGGREEEGKEEGWKEGRRDWRVEEGEGEEKEIFLTSQQNSVCGIL